MAGDALDTDMAAMEFDQCPAEIKAQTQAQVKLLLDSAAPGTIEALPEPFLFF